MTDSEKELVRPSMTDALIEKVASKLARTPLEQCDDEFRNTGLWGMCEEDARLAILCVLDHFSEPGNVTDGMQKGYEQFLDAASDVHTRKAAIAQAMRAARDEVSRG